LPALRHTHEEKLVNSRTWRVLLAATSICVISPSFADFKKGEKLQTIANLHPDMQRHVLFTLNYQQAGLIPVCSDVTVVKSGKKKLTFEYMGQEFEIGYEGYTEKAGVSFQEAVAKLYFGKSCDKAKLKSLGKIDQEGIRTGQPKVGMTRDGVLFAMGRPPLHANLDLGLGAWHYWRNRYGKLVVNFGDDGKVASIQ
jgi:hypothetical protein